MPALSLANAFMTIGHQNISTDATSITNISTHGIDVICAWPVSGQYGPGSRILYYVLISACVLARKAEWIKNACLAAALLLPAVASLHAIALAAFHRDGAVDLDIYGAFQLCAIGILAAPVTVRLSRTYFYDPGRNAIFLWTGLILAGLLSLTVEFYRAETMLCAMDNQRRPLSSDPREFPYDAQPTCNMICTAETGPQSPMRGGAANNKYVIPAPDKFTFGAGTILCAACCVHAVLWLASMMDKILEINWRSRFGINDETCNEPIEGTNGATLGKMYLVNETVRFFMSVAIVPIFASAGLAVLIVGEINFFSEQMRYENEPMASIGQWGPIVGTGLAVAGSLYLLLAADIEAVMRGTSETGDSHTCTCEHPMEPEPAVRRHSTQTSSNRPGFRSNKIGYMAAATAHRVESEGEIPRSPPDSPFSWTGSMRENDHLGEAQPGLSRDLGKRLSREMSKYSTASLAKAETSQSEGGSRKKVAAVLVAIGGALGSATHDSFDLSKFRDGQALDFPEIPGERERNVNLAHIREVYSKRLEEDGTPAVQASRSRASSFNGNGPSGHAFDNLRQSRDASRSASPVPSLSRPRASTLPVPVPSASQGPHAESASLTSSELLRGRLRQRRDTLEVPDVFYLRSLGMSSSPYRQPHPPASATTVTAATSTHELGTPASSNTAPESSQAEGLKSFPK
ncbi:hypothetical protein E4U57_000267 [Claviceps arundinis]|uniref:Uncharacterized protein n=1 Tax=Claviceps arundinis TaxID=1623583 RepID=A0A9P7MWZ8_9HYPO|nr:hypothetical protein E4U57_000267 [Claviceps arundinis]KAG5973331.1 hypothetical protein E4U56_005118 [Claviceps arundinis]